MRRGRRWGTGIYFTALIGCDVVCGCVNIDVARDKIIYQIASQGSNQQQHFLICFFPSTFRYFNIGANMLSELCGHGILWWM